MSVFHVSECARVVLSLVCMPCFMLERGLRIRHSCLVSVSCQGSDTRAPRSVSLCECAVSSSLFCSRVFCCVALKIILDYLDYYFSIIKISRN